MATRTQKYRQAAAAYFGYGLVYLLGAAHLGLTGASARASGGLIFYLVGAAIVVLFPWLLWKEFKWFARVLAVFLLYRLGGLAYVIAQDDGKTVPFFFGSEIPQLYGAVVFVIVTVVALVFVARAGFARGGEKKR